MGNATAENITAAVIASAAPSGDSRLTQIFASLVRHLHDFIREVELTPAEWANGVEFLTRTGKMCTQTRQEVVLLSDTCGVTMLVDALANRKTGGATESTVLGPFYTNDAPDIALNESIASEGKGVPLYVSGRIADTHGSPLGGALVEAWETDGDGLYDTQYERREKPDCRGRVSTAADGTYAFRAVVPVAYSIPTDGPVGALMQQLGRHTMRPAHLHFRISAAHHVPVTTAIYVEGDAYLDSDAVFGVKSSLVEPFVQQDSAYALRRDFVLEPIPVAERV